MSKIDKFNKTITAFCYTTGYSRYLLDKTFYKENKKAFLHLLKSIDYKDEDLRYIKFLTEAVKNNDFGSLGKVDTYFVYRDLSWLNIKKIVYHFFYLPKLKKLINKKD